MGLDIGYSTPYYGHFSRDNHVSFGVRLAIPAFQVRSGPMANSANPDLHGIDELYMGRGEDRGYVPYGHGR